MEINNDEPQAVEAQTTSQPAPDTSGIWDMRHAPDSDFLAPINIWVRNEGAWKNLLAFAAYNNYETHDDIGDYGPVVSVRTLGGFRYRLHRGWGEGYPLKRDHETYRKILWAVDIVSDPSYYTPGGKNISSGHLQFMRLFVGHYTEIPLEEWDAFAQDVSQDAPNFISKLAEFCFPGSAPATHPSALNGLLSLRAALSGAPLSPGQIEAVANATADPKESEVFTAVARRLQKG